VKEVWEMSVAGCEREIDRRLGEGGEKWRDEGRSGER